MDLPRGPVLPNVLADEACVQAYCSLRGSELGTQETDDRATGLTREYSREKRRPRHEMIWEGNTPSKPHERNLPSFAQNL